MAEDAGFPKTSNSNDGKTPGYPQLDNTLTADAFSGFQIPLSTNSTIAAKTRLGAHTARRCLIMIWIVNFAIPQALLLFLSRSHHPISQPVSSSSVTVAAHNVSCSYFNAEDLDVGFVVDAGKGMSFKNITVRTYHGNDVLSAAVTLPPFELWGNKCHIMGFKHNDLQVPIDKWESTTVGVSWVTFKVRFMVLYRGMEIAIKADCGKVKIRFSPAGTISNATQIANFNTTSCKTNWLWDYLNFAFRIYTLVSSLAISILGIWLGVLPRKPT